MHEKPIQPDSYCKYAISVVLPMIIGVLNDCFMVQGCLVPCEQSSRFIGRGAGLAASSSTIIILPSKSLIISSHGPPLGSAAGTREKQLLRRTMSNSINSHS